MAVITGFNSVNVQENTSFNLSGVSSLSVSNYGLNDLFIVISKIVRRRVPAFDPGINTPYIFSIDGDGTLSNIEIAIEFDGAKTGQAILDYRKTEKCPE